MRGALFGKNLMLFSESVGDLDSRSAKMRGEIRPDGFRRFCGEQKHSGMTMPSRYINHHEKYFL